MTDLDINERENICLVGVSKNGEVTYNLVENETDFYNTGLSVIHRLKDDTNKFIADMYLAQSYLGIDRIFDDRIIYSSDTKIKGNSNISTYDKLLDIILEDNLIDSVYIYDIREDLLIVNLPESNHFIALEYNDDVAINEFMEEFNL